jgi:hypothetical protein
MMRAASSRSDHAHANSARLKGAVLNTPFRAGTSMAASGPQILAAETAKKPALWAVRSPGL